MNKKELELYIHIPFCVRKCSYCDFLSAPATEQTREAYMAALFAEIGGRAKDYSFDSVYHRDAFGMISVCLRNFQQSPK